MAGIKLPKQNTRSIEEVARENFARVGLKAFAIRFIYAGEHGLTKEELTRIFKKSIDYVNAGYIDIPVHGLLLVYDSYFVHILEGSEDTLYRQLKFLWNIEAHWINKMTRKDEDDVIAAAEAWERAKEEAKEEGHPFPPDAKFVPPEKITRIVFKRLKMLLVYHNITTLLFHNWRAIFANPPSLVATLDLTAPIDEHMDQLKICLDKISVFCKLAIEDKSLSFDGLSANDPKMEALPEVVLLDYLLNSPHILDLREVSRGHRKVGDFIYYFEIVWPLSNAFTPRHLYKLKIDDSFVEPLPVMDWEVKAREEEEERKRDTAEDFQRESSDSD